MTTETMTTETISEPIKRFFEAEIANEECGGDSPSTLGTAKDSAYQLGLDELSGCTEAELPQVAEDFKLLLEKHGEDTLLVFLLGE